MSLRTGTAIGTLVTIVTCQDQLRGRHRLTSAHTSWTTTHFCHSLIFSLPTIPHMVMAMLGVWDLTEPGIISTELGCEGWVLGLGLGLGLRLGF